ncbi:MAG: BatD family protein, partial [Muribaculaceae bacterium]|nr:BatD family protein [Muribaculaceae bacterium]
YPSELEVYTPKTDVQAEVGSSNVSGKVTFDYSFMPLEEGSFKIPALRFVYFNPSTGKYETAQAKGYDISVGKGEASAKSHVNRQKKFDADLQPVDPDSLAKDRVPLVYRFPYWLFFIVPFCGLVVSVILYRSYVKSHADMAAFNSRRADKIARRRLKKAYSCMRKDDSEGFYDELLVALWGYMGDKLKMPTSELMRDNIRNVLESKEVPEKVIDGFISLLDTCEFAKYSSENAKSGMKTTYESAIKEINEVENSFKKSAK